MEAAIIGYNSESPVPGLRQWQGSDTDEAV
jgi:hypothetical protein